VLTHKLDDDDGDDHVVVRSACPRGLLAILHDRAAGEERATAPCQRLPQRKVCGCLRGLLVVAVTGFLCPAVPCLVIALPLIPPRCCSMNCSLGASCRRVVEDNNACHVLALNSQLNLWIETNVSEIALPYLTTTSAGIWLSTPSCRLSLVSFPRLVSIGGRFYYPSNRCQPAWKLSMPMLYSGSFDIQVGNLISVALPRFSEGVFRVMSFAGTTLDFPSLTNAEISIGFSDLLGSVLLPQLNFATEFVLTYLPKLQSFHAPLLGKVEKELRITENDVWIF
jgi:hypothetical protein